MYAIYGNMNPINIPPMLAYIPYMILWVSGNNPVGNMPFRYMDIP